MLAAVIAYLTYPLAALLHRNVKINWRILVSVLYLVIYLAGLGLLTWGGITLFEQVQSLIRFLEGAIQDVPKIVQGWIDTPPILGPFVLDLRQLDIVTAANQVLGIVQPLIGQAGTIVGTIASSAASIVGWIFFSFLLSYFIVSETGGRTENILRIDIPGYTQDLKRIVRELSMIWNAFLRGQLVVFLIVTTFYMVTFSILGVSFFYGLALLAGAGRFVPYIGQWISWGVSMLVAYSQGYTLFGMEQGTYVLVVFITAIATDGLIDNFISPRIFSNALKIHPAAVMVAAIVGFNMIGVMGIILAAPVLATLKLVMDYLFSKLLDQDPWANIVRASPPQRFRFAVRDRVKAVWSFLKECSVRVYAWFSQRVRSALGRR